MAIFGVWIEDNLILRCFVSKMQKKLNTPDLMQNPFKGFIRLEKGDEPYIFIYLALTWINPIFAFLFLTFGLWVAFGFSLTWIHLFLIPLGLGSFMFTEWFSKIAIYLSLKKYGYKGKIKFMNDTSLLLRLAKWDKKKL